jgi:hypothetical protein
MRAQNKVGLIAPRCGPSWNELSKMNLEEYGVMSFDSDAVSSATWSVKPFPPFWGSSQVTAANGTLAPQAIMRGINKCGTDSAYLIGFMTICRERVRTGSEVLSFGF